MQEVSKMKFDVDDENKTLYLYIPFQERENDFPELVNKYKKMKYRICKFISGTGNFKESITKLIMNQI